MLQEALYVGQFAAIGSLPVILMAFLAFGKILPLRRRAIRLLAAGATVVGFFLFSSLSWMLLGNEIMTAMVLMALYLDGWVYLPITLEATALLYHRWLFRPDENFPLFSIEPN